MYSIDYTNRFKKDLKRCQKRGFSFTLFCYLNELSYLCTRNSLTPQTLSEERGGQGAR